jgi:putative tail protein/endosialidase-like protein
MEKEGFTNTILITAIKDPFDPVGSRVINRIPWEGKTVQQYIEQEYMSVPEEFEIIASINGQVLEGDDVFLTIPQAGSNLVFCLTPSGDNVWHAVAMLALVVINIYTYGVLTPVIGKYSAALVSAGIMIGGGMLVNAILPPQSIETDNAADSSTYGWRAGTNQTGEGHSCPVIYGTIKITPYRIGRFVWTTALELQTLYLLYLVADHEIDSITDIKINGNPIADYDSVSTVVKYGTTYQTYSPHFHDTFTQKAENRKLSHDAWVTATVVGSNNTGIGVGIVWPQGIGKYNDEGNLEGIVITYGIEYRAVGGGPGDWATMAGSVEIGLGYAGTVRDYRRIRGLPPDEYEIRAFLTIDPPTGTRYLSDTYLEYTDGIVEDNFTYPGTALLSINALATDQLSGDVPSVSCIVTRSTVPVYVPGSGWQDKPADNPAWICYDMLVNDEYGGGVSYLRMNYSEFSTWATFCTTNGYSCNIIFDVQTTFPAALAKASTIGRARVVLRGSNFGVVVDKADSPVQLFGVGNIIENTFSQSYIAKKDRANAIDVTFLDENNDYDSRTFQVRAYDYDTNPSLIVNKLSLTLYGATTKTIATEYVNFLLNCNQYLTTIVEFEVGVDALASTIGDVIYVSHDVPQWGYSGRVLSATSNTVTIDREVTLQPAITYHILMRHYDDDTLEEVALASVGVPTTTDVLTLSGTWSQIPVVEDIYAFGEINKVAKEFRITNITRTDKMRRKIKALEYRSEVYNDSISIPDYDPDTSLEPFVDGLIAMETYRNEGGVVVAYVVLSWIGFGVFYVFMKDETDRDWTSLGSVVGDNRFEVRNLEPGRTYYFKVSVSGHPGSGELAVLTFDGWTAPRIIWPVTGLEIYGQGNNTVFQNRDLKLAWHLASSNVSDGADDEPYGAGTFPPIAEFGGYRIQVCDSDGTVRREFFQVDSFYTYTYEMNVEDGSPPAANLIIKVWAQDIYGQMSESPAILSVSNPAPAAPSGLTSEPWMKGVHFEWAFASEIDFLRFEYRTKVETDSWSSWIEYSSNSILRFLTETEETVHGTEADIYIEVKAVDTFGTESSVTSSNAAALGLNIQPADIDDFAITASKIFTKIPIVDGDSWTSDSPSANYVAWNAHTIYYNGVGYSINAGNTNLKYIWWVNAATSYSGSDTHPGATLNDGDFIIAVNIDGSYDLAWNADANQVIGSAYIQDLAVNEAKIANLAVSTAKIANLAVSEGKIDNLAVTNAKINDLDAAKITSGFIAAARIQAGSILVTALDSDATDRMFDDDTRDFADIGGSTKPADNATKNQIFYQDGVPTGDTGDIWIDTNNGNKAYVAQSDGSDEITAGEWVEQFELADWAKVFGTNKPDDNATQNIVYYQAGIPTGNIGDIWFKTDDGNKPYVARSNGSDEITAGEWESVQDSTIAAAQSAADDAQTDADTALSIADGVIQGYFQDSAPGSGMAFGDIWIDTDKASPVDSTCIYRYEDASGGSQGSLDWRLKPTSAIGLSYIDILTNESDVITAQATADGKITTFFQDAIPTSEGIGDIWIDTNDDNKPYVAESAGADEITAGEWVEAGFDVATWSKVIGAGKPDDYAGTTDSNLNKDASFIGGYNDDGYWSKSYTTFVNTGGEANEINALFTGNGQYGLIRMQAGHLFPMRKGDVFYIKARIYQSTSLDGTYGLFVQVNGEDASNTPTEYTTSGSLSATEGSWIDVEGLITITHADTVQGNIGLYLHNTNTTGTARCNYLYISRANPADFSHSTDQTYIDGGKIYTGTIAAAQIKGTNFGTLTLSSSSKIIIDAALGVEINSGAGMLIKEGGDLTFQKTSGTSEISAIHFKGSGGTEYGRMSYQEGTSDDFFRIGAYNGADLQIAAYGGGHVEFWSDIYCQAGVDIIVAGAPTNTFIGLGSSDGRIVFNHGTPDIIRFSSCNIGIGNAATSTRLYVKTQGVSSATYGLVIINTSSNNCFYSRDDRFNWAWDLTVANDFIDNSDVRMKEDVSYFDEGLDEVLLMSPCTYTYKEDITSDVKIGMVAQDLELIDSKMVIDYYDDFADEMRKGIKPLAIYPYLINAIKALHNTDLLVDARVVTLETKVAELEKLLP